MDIHSFIATCRTYFKSKTPHQQKIAMVFGILGLLVLIVLLKSCLAKSHPKIIHEPQLIRTGDTIEIPPDSPLRSHLTVQSVVTSDAPHIVVFPGIVEADQTRTLNILPPVTGRLVRLDVKLGDEVKKDQVLAVIQSSGLAQAYADKIKAQSALQQASEALQRAQKVNRAGANSIKDLEFIQNNYIQAKAEMQRAQTTLDALGNNEKQQLNIQAPIDGKIISLNYGNGSYINDTSQPLFILSNINSVWVTACIPEGVIASVAKGQKVDVFLSAYPKQVWKGAIAFINQFIDVDSRCNKSRIAFTNTDEKLQPNMYASIHTQIPQDEQVIVPLSAVLMNDDTISVFVETAPWVFTRREVVLGTEDGDKVRIASGLKAGDRIISEGGILVND